MNADEMIVRQRGEILCNVGADYFAAWKGAGKQQVDARFVS
jgi:hypothetical protein